MSGDGKSLVESAGILQSLLDDVVRRTMSLEAEHDVKRQQQSGELLGKENHSQRVSDLEGRYNKICNSHKDLGLKFSALQSTVRTAQNSQLISQLLMEGLKEERAESPFVEELDPEEMKYIKELLDEQNELSKEVFATQVRIFQSELALSKTRVDLLSSFVSLKEMKSPEEEEEGPEMSHKATQLQDTLTKEEEKLNQLQFFALSVVSFIPSLGLDMDSVSSSKQKKLIIDCGRPLDELRSDNH